MTSLDNFSNAQVCLNGHIIAASTRDQPALVSKYCSQCGRATITKCQKCNSPIRGNLYRITELLSGMTLPKYCHDCGAPYPWTENRLLAAHELISKISDLSDEDKETLNMSLDELVNDTPKTKLAISRFKQIIAKADKETANTLKSIIVDFIRLPENRRNRVDRGFSFDLGDLGDIFGDISDKHFPREK